MVTTAPLRATIVRFLLMVTAALSCTSFSRVIVCPVAAAETASGRLA